MDTRLVRRSYDELLEAFEQWLPAEGEHALALHHAWALLTVCIPPTACGGCAKRDSNRAEDVDKVICEGADGFDHDALNLQERWWTDLPLEVLRVDHLADLLRALVEGARGMTAATGPCAPCRR